MSQPSSSEARFRADSARIVCFIHSNWLQPLCKLLMARLADFKPLFDPGPPMPHLPFAERDPLPPGEGISTGVAAFLDKVSQRCGDAAAIADRVSTSRTIDGTPRCCS